MRMRTPGLWTVREWVVKRTDEPLGAAVLVSLVAGLFVLALAGPSYFPARGDQRETARLIDVAESGEQISCGRQLWDGTTEFIYTYRVNRPPASLPATFRIYGCPDNGNIGDTVTVARSGSGEDADVHLEPIGGVGLIGFTLGLAAAAGLVSLLWQFARDRLGGPASRGNGCSARQ